jgi:hypothetical protein
MFAGYHWRRFRGDLLRHGRGVPQRFACRYLQMLDCYIGEFTVPIINMKNLPVDIKIVIPDNY